MAEIILNQSRVGSLVGSGEATGAAYGDGPRRAGRRLAARIQNQIDGRAVQRLALLTDKKYLAGPLHPERCLSHAPIAFGSSPRKGCAVETPFFNRTMYNMRLWTFTWSRVKPRTHAIHAGTSAATAVVAGPRCGCLGSAISLPTSSPVRWLRPASRRVFATLNLHRAVVIFLGDLRPLGFFIILSRTWRSDRCNTPHKSGAGFFSIDRRTLNVESYGSFCRGNRLNQNLGNQQN